MATSYTGKYTKQIKNCFDAVAFEKNVLQKINNVILLVDEQINLIDANFEYFGAKTLNNMGDLPIEKVMKKDETELYKAKKEFHQGYNMLGKRAWQARYKGLLKIMTELKQDLAKQNCEMSEINSDYTKAKTNASFDMNQDRTVEIDSINYRITSLKKQQSIIREEEQIAYKNICSYENSGE